MHCARCDKPLTADDIEDGSWLCDECIEAEIERHHEQEEAD